MTAAKLRAGIVHLRRLARAHAAGEMSTTEYRRRRRAYIETWRQVEDWTAGDATIPRGRVAALEPGPAPDAGPPADPGRTAYAWRWVMPFGVVLLVMLGGHLAG